MKSPAAVRTWRRHLHLAVQVNQSLTKLSYLAPSLLSVTCVISPVVPPTTVFAPSLMAMPGRAVEVIERLLDAANTAHLHVAKIDIASDDVRRCSA
jgi:hypothetical protein